jgi:AraC-like DNA-binding protein
MSIIDRALWVIERNSNQALSLGDIAGACGVSRSHLAAAFGTAVGQPVMRYVRSRRLSAAAKALGAANDAWERGDYIAALNGYIRLLESPDADAVLDAIALQTGELFTSHELMTDGRNPRFSPDARYAAYETGLEVSRRTRLIRNDGTASQVVELPGVAHSKLVYLSIPAGTAMLVLD